MEHLRRQNAAPKYTTPGFVQIQAAVPEITFVLEIVTFNQSALIRSISAVCK